MIKFSRRSEYEHALNLSRKARRRGDVAAAERWLKHADRHMAATQREYAVIEEYRLKDALEAASAREQAKLERLRAARAQGSVDEGPRKP